MSAPKALRHTFLILLLITGVIGCATVPPLAHRATEQSSSQATDASSPAVHPVTPGTRSDPDSKAWTDAQRRAGLATTFGETIDSKIDYKDFKRGFLAKPYAVGVLYYNDHEGAAAMAQSLGGAVTLGPGLVTTPKGVADWGLKSPGSGYLGGYLADEKMILTGKKGDRYAVVLKNNTRQPLEFVVSVDGLDVIDGEPAAYAKRGYIVGPKHTIEVKGFRTSTDQVAAFRFGRVPDSYAAVRHGDPRNVGVIGVAIFSQGGKNPWRQPKSSQREGADPFPGQRFAIPPY